MACRRSTENKEPLIMSTNRAIASPMSSPSDAISKLSSPYARSPNDLTGMDDSLYERHLVFDNVVDPAALGPRERFEAIARTVRDILAQRWINTETTYK